MDIEQLKLLLSALQGVAGDTKTLLVWWLASNAVLKVLGWLMFAGIVLVIVRTIHACSRDATTVAHINEILGKPGSGWVQSPKDHLDLVEAVRQVKNAKAA